MHSCAVQTPKLINIDQAQGSRAWRLSLRRCWQPACWRCIDVIKLRGCVEGLLEALQLLGWAGCCGLFAGGARQRRPFDGRPISTGRKPEDVLNAVIAMLPDKEFTGKGDAAKVRGLLQGFQNKMKQSIAEAKAKAWERA